MTGATPSSAARDDLELRIVGYPIPLARAWTAIVVAHPVRAFLTRRDDDRLMRELACARPDPAA